MKIWFQNRRMKWRNSKERELLASGGSRDQTLPTKNNPNPDLSDARCDRPASISPPASPTDLTSTGLQTIQQQKSSSAHPLPGLQQQTHSMQLLPQLTRVDPSKFSPEANTDIKKDPSQGIFKAELDESRHRRLFGSLYESERDSGAFDFDQGPPDSHDNGKMYYDDYDSNSDSDEEISVT